MTSPKGRDDNKADGGENIPSEATINKVNPNSAGRRAAINSENITPSAASEINLCCRNQSVNSQSWMLCTGLLASKVYLNGSGPLGPTLASLSSSSRYWPLIPVAAIILLRSPRPRSFVPIVTIVGHHVWLLSPTLTALTRPLIPIAAVVRPGGRLLSPALAALGSNTILWVLLPTGLGWNQYLAAGSFQKCCPDLGDFQDFLEGFGPAASEIERHHTQLQAEYVGIPFHMIR